MANFDSGVKRYIKAVAVVETNFPVDWKDNVEIACKHCNYFVRATQRCGLTQQIVNFPDKYVGECCPLNASEAVALARRKARLEYRRRQRLYNLRDLEKKGKALLAAGITREVLDAMYSEESEDE